MDRVREQGDRAGDDHDGGLGIGGHTEAGEADLDGPDALGAGLEGLVDRVGRIVAVRLEDGQEEPL